MRFHLWCWIPWCATYEVHGNIVHTTFRMLAYNHLFLMKTHFCCMDASFEYRMVQTRFADRCRIHRHPSIINHWLHYVDESHHRSSCMQAVILSNPVSFVVITTRIWHLCEILILASALIFRNRRGFPRSHLADIQAMNEEIVVWSGCLGTGVDGFRSLRRLIMGQ